MVSLIEAAAEGDLARVGALLTGHSEQEFAYHCVQLVDAGFLAGNVQMANHGMIIINKLAWQGHEFLDAVRDPDVWQKTKEQAKGVASVGLGFLWEIAKAEVKMKLGLP
jgi:hypothetical protein